MSILTGLTVAGTVGAGLVIVAYLLNQLEKLPSTNVWFPLLNLIGAVLILLSLIAEWNLPTAVIEGFWVAISIYGLANSFAKRRAA